MKIRSEDIELVGIGTLNPCDRNPNKHTPEQIDRLAKLIEYQGFRDPIIVSNQSGKIVCGHGRWEAAKKLELPQVPIIRQDFETPEMEYAHMVADNEVARWAEPDLAMINADLPELGPDLDIELLGMKDFEIEPMDKFGTPNEKELDENLKTSNECPSCGYKW